MHKAPKILKFVLTLLLVFHVVFGYAQRAVQVITTIKSPYSTLLSEYYTGSQAKLSVMLINTDVSQPFLQVYLRMSIEGQGVSLQTAPYGNYPTIDLMTGSPVTISENDLAPYFSASNLIGSTGGGQNRLAEGFYQFCFEVYEKNTHRLVGDKQCAQAYLTLSDPPFLILPEKAKVIAYTNPFNLLFQWTPRHLANPNAFNTEYEFSLVELWDDAIAPEAAFYTAQPIYTTKTNTPNLFYGPAEPQLLMGKKYAWRVKTMLTNSVNQQEPFRNDGYTEVFWFKLQGECLPLQKAIVTADPKTNKTTLSWTPDPTNVGSTKIQVRKKGASKWNIIDAPNHQTTLTGLAWDSDYEYQLGNRCIITDDIAYGSLQSFKTLRQDTTTCVPSQAEALINQEPLASLRTGDTIYASGFRMRLTRVSGANGNFSGEGYLALYVPTTTTEVSIKASFRDIGVNTDKQLISGKIVSIYDATEGGIADVDPVFQGGMGTGDVITGNTTVTMVNGTIDPSVFATVSVNIDGTYTVTVTEVDGSPISITVSKLPAVVQDNKGKIYQVDKDGKIIPVGAVGPKQTALLGGKSPAELNKLSPEKGVVVFKAHADQKYALDLHQAAYNKSIYFAQQYESLNQGAYRVGNKLLVENSTDKVTVTIQSLAAGMNADSVRFVTGRGVELIATKKTSNTYEITVLSGPADDAQELYAVYSANGTTKDKEENSDKETKEETKEESVTYSLGKLKIATYKAKEYKVNLVPVGDAQIDERKVAQKLNAIYNKVGITWTVERLPIFGYEGWDDGDKILDVTDAGKKNKYSVEMQKLNTTYITTKVVDESVPYLFVFDKQPKNGKGTVEGDMLRNRQFGYLFSSSSETSKTAAHELGHGMFHLKHTFDEQYKLNEGDLPENLMDYRTGETLAKLQWDAIHAPGLVIGVFEKEGDGAFVSGYGITPDFKFVKTNTYTASYDILVADGFTGGFEYSEDGSKSTYYWDNFDKAYIKQGTTNTKFLGAIVSTLNDNDVVYIFFDNKLECGSRKYIKTTYGAIKDSLTTAGLDKYIIDNKNKTANKSPNVFASLLDCIGNDSGNGSNNATFSEAQQRAVLVSYLSTPYSNTELAKLLSGLKKTVSEGNAYHSKIVKLFLTDESTSPSDIIKVQNYSVKGDTIKLWLHQGINGWEIKTTHNKIDAWIAAYNNAGYRFTLTDFTSALGSSIEDLAVGTYELLDQADKLLGYLKVPEYVWNCDSKDYKPIYGKVYSFVIKPVTTLVITLSKTYIDDFLNINVSNNNLRIWLSKLSQKEVQFAFDVGVYNGAIDILKSVPQLLQVLPTLISGELRQKFVVKFNQFLRFENKDTKEIGPWAAVQYGFSQQFDYQKPCLMSHSIAGVGMGIAISFVDPAAVAGSTCKALGAVVQLLVYADKIADPFQAAKFILKPIVKGGTIGCKILTKTGNEIFQIVDEGGKKIFKILNATGDALNTIDWNLLKQVNFVDQFGNGYFGGIKLNDEFLESLGNAKVVFMNSIDDGAGNILKDADGNYLAKVVKEGDPSHETIGVVRAVNGAGSLANYPKIRAVLGEIDPILKSAGFDRYRFENLIRQSDNLNYLEENASLLTEIANKVKTKMQYTDTDLLKIFKDAVNTDFVKSILPANFTNTLKTFGKTEDEIVSYFKNYHNVYTKGEFFTQIENIITKNNLYNLTKDEAFALWGYTTNFFYRDLNIWLREGSNISKTTPIVNLMRQAMQKVPKYNGTAYRALEFNGDALTSFLNKYGVKGKEVTFDDFLSAGTTKEAAFFNKAEKNIRIVMEVKDAPIISSVADGIKFRGYSPDELLLNTGKKFFISDVKSLPNGIYEIRMTQLN